MKIKQSIYILLILFLMFSCKENTYNPPNNPQKPIVEANDIDKIEPPHWWIGFKDTSLQLLVKHSKISLAKVFIENKNISLKKVHTADSPNYLFLDLIIKDSAKPGKFVINFETKEGATLSQSYELKKRIKKSEDFIGFDSSDAIYLITPDRYRNSDVTNDSFENLHEKEINRKDNYARHGGDIKGIINSIDYIKNLGFTTVWPSPLLENNMHNGSYHGYAITDYYKVDPRFGTTSEYIELSAKLQKQNMKLIMDQVANHCGLEHWWMKDLPFKDWVNYQKHYEANKENWSSDIVKRSSHRRTTNQDLYASKIDHKEMTDGWFVKGMPDLNQRNPFMAKYLIQNSIWWIEKLGLGGIRQDTYPYPDKEFMSNWAGAIMNEYPNFNIVGEEWSTNPLLIAYWQQGHKNVDGYNSNLRSTMDFAMQEKIVSGLNNEETWGTGLKEIYETLANDFHYKRPLDILVFPDNHDMSRIFTQLNGDIIKTKMALSYLAVLPRIFQMYYGTEILMNDFDRPGDHGLIRTDFPGGWKNDSINAFTGENLTTEKKEMQQFITNLLNFRKTSTAIHNGKTMHFVPKAKTYLLARYNESETIVHVLNKNEKPVAINLDRFKELELTGKTLKNVLTGDTILWNKSLKLPKKGSYLFTTKY